MSLAVIDRPPDLAALSDSQLESELAKGLNLSADSLLYTAAVWAELERRGKDLSAVRGGVGRTIMLIAAGRLAAEAVVAFIGRPGVLQALDGLPLDRQRELAAGGTIEVYDPDRKAVVKAKLTDVQTPVIRRVLADGRERDAESQRLALTGRAKRRTEEPAREYRVVVDRERRVVRVGRMEVSVEEVLAAFAVAAVGDRVSDADLVADAKKDGKGIAAAECRLTKEEDERLRAACKAKKLDRGEAVRMAVVAMHLL